MKEVKKERKGENVNPRKHELDDSKRKARRARKGGGGGREGRERTNDRILVEEVEDFSLEDVRPWSEYDSSESDFKSQKEEAD